MQIPTPVQESVWLDQSLLDFRPDARPHLDEELKKLAKSMSARQFQNIIVCRVGDRYVVIAGVGRVLAARMLGWDKIRADVYEGLAEAQMLSMMFDENEDRENPPALYQAKVLKSIIENQGMTELTQQDIADKIGVEQGTVSKYMSLFRLSPLIWENYSQCIKLGTNDFAQLLRIENSDDQWKVAKVAVEKDLSANALQQVVDKLLGVKSTAKKMGRPKKSKTLGEDGFEVKKKKNSLLIRGILQEAQDPGDFISRLHAEILRLRAPQPAPSEAENGSEKIPAGTAS